MPLTLTCPFCDSDLRFPEAARGQTLRCPKCQGEFEVAPPEPEEDLFGSLELADPDPPAEEPIESEEVVEVEEVEEVVEVEEVAPPEEEVVESVELVEPDAPAPPLTPAAAAGPAGEPERKRRKKKKKPKGLLQRLGLPAIAIDEGLSKVLTIGVVGVVAVVLGYFGIRAAFSVPPPPEIPESEWVDLDVPGRFKARLPGNAERITQSAAGINMVLYQVKPGNDEHSWYYVAYSDNMLPAAMRAKPVDQILEESCDGVLATSQAQIKTQELKRAPIQLGDIPGREQVLRIPAVSVKAISR